MVSSIVMTVVRLLSGGRGILRVVSWPESRPGTAAPPFVFLKTLSRAKVVRRKQMQKWGLMLLSPGCK